MARTMMPNRHASVGLNRRTGVVYVLNTQADSVTIVDGRALRVLATPPVEAYPIALAIGDGEGSIRATRGSRGRSDPPAVLSSQP